jgi:hypothetical protein
LTITPMMTAEAVAANQMRAYRGFMAEPYRRSAEASRN